MIKQCSQITFFESWIPVLRYTSPAFFNEQYPDCSKVFAAIKDAEKRPPKDEIERKIMIWVYELLNRDTTKYRDRLDKVNVNMKKINEGKMVGKEKDKLMDDLYLSRIGAKIVDNVLKVTTKEMDMDKQEGDIYMVLERMLECFFYYDDCGRNNIRVEEQLMHELVLTGVQGVTADFLKLPFSSFLLLIPHNQVLTIRKTLIKEIYIDESEYIEANITFRKIELCMIDVENNITLKSLLFQNQLSLVEQTKEQILDRYDSKLAREEATAIISFILATILYINSTEKKEQIIMPTVILKEKHTRFPQCALGYGIPINKTIHTSNSSKGSSHQINVLKFTVRGHYRTYKSGENARWKVDTVIWIRPFLKGLERNAAEGSIKPKKYELK